MKCELVVPRRGITDLCGVVTSCHPMRGVIIDWPTLASVYRMLHRALMHPNAWCSRSFYRVIVTSCFPAQVTPDASGLNPLQAPPAEEREVAAIVAFAARYYSGMPFEVPGAFKSCALFPAPVCAKDVG